LFQEGVDLPALLRQVPDAHALPAALAEPVHILVRLWPVAFAQEAQVYYVIML
jgi:hypothetical protein